MTKCIGKCAALLAALSLAAFIGAARAQDVEHVNPHPNPDKRIRSFISCTSPRDAGPATTATVAAVSSPNRCSFSVPAAPSSASRVSMGRRRRRGDPEAGPPPPKAGCNCPAGDSPRMRTAA